MKRLLGTLLFLAAPALMAQPTLRILPSAAVGDLPTCDASHAHRMVSVSDGSSATDCTVGGGSDIHPCFCNGSTWSVSFGAGAGGGEANQDAFSIITVSGQSNVVADAATDTLTLAEGSNITITTDAGTDTVTIAAAGGGGDSVSIDGVAVVDPDFVSAGDVGVTDTANTITLDLNADVVDASHMADADHGDVAWSSGVASVQASTALSSEIDSDITTHAAVADAHHAATVDTNLTDEEVQDKAGAMVTGNTETGIAVTYQDGDGTIDFVAEVTQSELDTHAGNASVHHAATVDTGPSPDCAGSNTYQDGEGGCDTGYLDADGTDDDTPDAGDFAAATDLDLNGALALNACVEVQGSVAYYTGSAWSCLGAGTVGQVLESQGAAANPQWGTDDTGGGGANSFETQDAPAGTDPVADSATDTLAWTVTAPLTLTGNSTTDAMAFAWSGTFPDAQVAQSNVTQHEAALSITESQISDLAHTATAITDGLIIEADLNADEAPADNDILTYDTTGANFSWQTPAELALATTSHAATHSDAGSDEITAENLATACTDAQVLGGDGVGGVECQTDAGGTPGTDSVGTTELDDDANTPVAGSIVVVEVGAASFDYIAQHAGTDVTADLEEETHASEHETGGNDSISHDSLTNFVAAEHVDWAGASAGTIHTDNYIEGTAHVATGITDGLIVEADLNEDSGTPTDADVLTYDSTGANFNWIAQSGVAAGTAAALAANGGNCTAGSYPLGVDTAGAVESCTDASTETDSIVATHTAVIDAHIDHADTLAELNTQITSGLVTGAHFTPTAGISTDHGAGAVTALTDIGDLCAGDQYLARNTGDTAWECVAEPSAGGAPTTADYLVGTADAGLSAEIVVGTSPGGELGGTWASPTLDDSVTVTGWVMGASTATSPAADDNDTSLATSAFVQGEINGAGGTGLTCGTGVCNVDLGADVDIGAGSTEITGTLPVASGGTGAVSLTDGGLLLGSGTGAITALGVATNGQIPVGDGTTDPVLATLTGTASEIEITNGVGTITIGIPTAPTLTDPVFSTSAQIPNGAAPTVNAAGEIAEDTTANQLIYGSTPNVLHPTICETLIIENLAAADDNYPLGMKNFARTITAIGVHCAGTCTTGADISLEDRAGNAMTHTVPTHSTGTGSTTFQNVTAANALVSGEGLRFDVDNAVSPETDTYEITVCFTVDRQ